MAGPEMKGHTADDVVRLAREWIGTPYHHQASVRGVGTDCLGLVRGVWRELYGRDGEVPPAYAGDWAEATGEETLLAAAGRHLLPRERDTPVGWLVSSGDVLVFRYRRGLVAKHVGIASCAGAFIHAIEGRQVAEVPLSPWWRRRVAGVFSFPGLVD